MPNPSGHSGHRPAPSSAALKTVDELNSAPGSPDVHPWHERFDVKEDRVIYKRCAGICVTDVSWKEYLEGRMFKDVVQRVLCRGGGWLPNAWSSGTRGGLGLCCACDTVDSDPRLPSPRFLSMRAANRLHSQVRDCVRPGRGVHVR